MKFVTAIQMVLVGTIVAILVGCGPPPPPPPDPTVNLPAGHGISSGSYSVQPGASLELGNVVVSCPSGGMPCMLRVSSPTASTGTFERNGGEPEIMAAVGSLNLPENHMIPADSYTIAAGDSMEYGNVEVSCPPGGGACVLTVPSSTATEATYEKTGGRPQVVVLTADSGLPEFHGIPTGMEVTIPAGEEHHGQHGVTLACPAGGPDCVVDISAGGGEYHRTGGMPEVVYHNLVWAVHDEDANRPINFFTRGISTGTPSYYRVDDSRATANPNRIQTYAAKYMDGAVDIEVVMVDPGERLYGAVPLDASDPNQLLGSSNIPELPAAWTGHALSKKVGDLTYHANMYTNVQYPPNPDYMVLGVWLAVPDVPTSDDSLAGVLVDGHDRYTESYLDKLAGTSTYTGPAIGIYETRTMNSSDEIRIGSFVASAELTANFDTNTVSGSILGFDENGDILDISDVTLDGASFVVGGAYVNNMNGTASYPDGMGTNAVAGNWSAAFYGNALDSNNNPVNPNSIAGSFEVEFGDRMMPAVNDSGFVGLVGAFGACNLDSGGC